MNRNESLWVLQQVVFLGLMVFVTGCAKKIPEPLRIGINAWPGYEFLYLAQEKGFYQDLGVAVKLVEFNSLADARRAYERGQIDGLGTSVIDVLQSREQSTRAPQVVQVIDYSNGADVIIAKSSVKNGAALRGKKIGVELGSLGTYVLARGLEKFGLTLADVQLISMDQISMEEAINNGSLDAIVTYPPKSINIISQGKATKIFDTAEIPGEVVDVIAIDDQVIQQRSVEVSNFLKAYQKALHFTEQNPIEAYHIMAAREGISADEFRAALQAGMHVVTQAEQGEFFKAGGKLASVIDTSDRILRQSLQIKGPDRREGIVNALFVEQDAQQ